jgi:hypothetical protein
MNYRIFKLPNLRNVRDLHLYRGDNFESDIAYCYSIYAWSNKGETILSSGRRTCWSQSRYLTNTKHATALYLTVGLIFV